MNKMVVNPIAILFWIPRFWGSFEGIHNPFPPKKVAGFGHETLFSFCIGWEEKVPGEILTAILL